MTEERKAQMRQYTRERRARFLAAGVCIDCGRPRQDGVQRCVGCHGKMRDRAAGYQGRKRGEDPDRVGATVYEIAAELGVSHQRVSIIIDVALRKLRLACLRAGIDPSDITGAPRSMLARAEDWA